MQPWDHILHVNNPRNHEGELQVLTLEGSLRQAIVRPGAMEFGAIDVRTGDDVLLVTERGSFPGGAREPEARSLSFRYGIVDFAKGRFCGLNFAGHFPM